MNRIFLFVLDSFGIGALPDAAQFGDHGVHTLAACVSSGELHIPNLTAAGLGNIDGVDCLPQVQTPTAAYGRMAEASMGKDTTIGHWEIAGIVSKQPLPTYPNGFPEEIIEPFCQATGRGVLGNIPASGTEIIAQYGDEHIRTGKLIVYTSADSVFQIAAHEEILPPEELYRYCRIARELLRGKHGVGRVIARPFVGTSGAYRRTANRHDFSLEPPAETILDALRDTGHDTIAVGKIFDIFAGKGITEHVYTSSNRNGMELAMQYAQKDFHGLCFVNLVDFDMLFGHRRDPVGYARALSEFDAWLPGFLKQMGEEDLVILTADHGCDPSYQATTDHTREYVPLLMFGKNAAGKQLGTRSSFTDVAATIAERFGITYATPGESFLIKS
ncbi:phosphopentomutase [Candidatus Avoscillospira sp. LCP25S3_F1]|uniref:phosphopentomutase n=1 Tax=Candidatus Avoscillospira sp. LCP25S3_F1 TaxID=3438825 RepID=UPI003F933F39